MRKRSPRRPLVVEDDRDASKIKPEQAIQMGRALGTGEPNRTEILGVVRQIV